MAIPQSASILHHLRQTVLRHDGAGLSDGQLLRSFLYRGDEAAFEALVRRHGPMVRGVCRRVLRNLDDADDAFQAAFLVLLRKASTLATREVLGDWLHGVAYRTALKARTAAARRRMKEKQALREEAILDQEERSEWLPLLDEEIGRLPPKYRLPLVICDLEGRTRKEAARQLGWPEGTVSGRLSRARDMLARRLTRRGVTLSVATLAAGMAGEASARLPFSIVGPICKAALEGAAGTAAGSVPAHVTVLSEGVVKAMFLSKLKNAVALMTVALLLTASAGAWCYVAVAGQDKERPQEIPAPAAPKGDAAQAPKIYPQPTAAAIPEADAAHSPMAAPKPAPPAPRAIRTFQIDMQLAEMKDGKHKMLAEPRLQTLEGRPASFVIGGHETIPLGGGKTEQVWIGKTIRTIIRSGKGDKVHLDITVSLPTRTSKSDDVVILETKTSRYISETTLDSRLQFAVAGKDSMPLIVTVGVQEIKPETGEKKVEEAEKQLNMAEFWRRAGHFDSARFYYERIRRRYPNTIYDERAKKRLAELKEIPPARIGQIFIIGNKKISDGDILEQLNLYPGQVFNFPDLRAAEQNLARLKGLKSKPKVTVIDPEGDREFKDIEITVEEK